MTATWDSLERNGLDGIGWAPVISVSILFHAALFSILLYFPESFSVNRRPGLDNTVMVRLVDAPGRPIPGRDAGKSKGASPSNKKESAAVPTKKPARRIAPVKKEEKPVVVAKRTVKKKTTPVKKTVSASELIDQAIKKIDRKVKAETEKAESVDKTQGDHLEQALAGVEARARDGRSEGVGVSGFDGVPGTAMQIYMANVEQWVMSNWSYPVALKSDPDIHAIVQLDVQRDGKILSSRFIRRSSDPVFDESVLRAIERSDPLPPFPEIYRRSHDEIRIHFSLPEGENP